MFWKFFCPLLVLRLAVGTDNPLPAVVVLDDLAGDSDTR